ncbi:unnamed protein product [Echinostoma caproni]|uniref:RVP domain-containing protein n=1 Tax=Echinostoma caproni TaxID=27848 RepID=A0A183BFS0_9TREM|nr:unnamed protein product [Echinostoma caproni]
MSAKRSLSDHNRLSGPNLRLSVTSLATEMGSPRIHSGDYSDDTSANPPTIRTRLPQITFTAAPSVQLEPPPRFEAGTNLTLWQMKMQRFLRRVPTEEHSLCILDLLSDQVQELLINENVDEESPQSQVNHPSLRHQYWRRDQKPGESAKQYADELGILVSRGFPEKSKEVQREVALERFRDGPLNPVAKRELQGRAPTTLGEAVRRVETFDIQSLVRNEAQRRSEEPKQASSSQVNGPRSEARVPWRTKPQRNGGAARRWQQQESIESPLCSVSLPIIRGPMESQCFPLLLTVGLKGEYVSALVDTGATCSLIDVDQCQIRESSRDGSRVKAVNGAPLQTWGCLDVEFQMTGTKVKHPMVVASNLPWKMILGIDFLRHFEICLDLCKNILTFDGKVIHMGSGEASEEDWAL